MSGAIARARFAVWVAFLRLRLRRRGGRLVLRAPHGGRFDAAPRVKLGAEGAVLTLRLGRGVVLGRELVLDLRGACALTLGDGAYLQRGCRVELRDGGSVTLGAHSHVRDGAVLKADGDLRVGEEVTIGYHAVLSCTERIEIGDRSGLGERVTVIDADHGADGTNAHYLRRPLSAAPVVLGPNVLVSANAVILRGATVGANAVIGAGAVVRAGEHAAGWVHAGVPAKPVRELPGAR